MSNEIKKLIKDLVQESQNKDKYIEQLHADISKLHLELLRKEEVIQKYEDPASADTLAE